MIVFKNEGELDLVALSTFGLHAKETDSPIGRFGTGLKYALATLLRHGCEITVNAEFVQLHIGVSPGEFRGRPVEYVVARSDGEEPLRLGFTTDLGRDWEPWQAYRELWSNAKDEGGGVHEARLLPKPAEGLVSICVEGDAIEQTHRERQTFLLSEREGLEVLHDCDACTIYRGESSAVFYRGIKVLDLSKPAAFTYDIKGRLWLSEDRTTGTWEIEAPLLAGLTSWGSVEAAEALHNEDRHEGTLSPASVGESLANNIMDVYERPRDDHNPTPVRPRLYDVASRSAPVEAVLKRIPRTESSELWLVRRRLDDYGFAEVKTVVFAPEQVQGAFRVHYDGGVLMLGKAAMKSPSHMVSAALQGAASIRNRFTPLEVLADVVAGVSRETKEEANDEPSF